MAETRNFEDGDHDGACSCGECEELDMREIRQAHEPRTDQTAQGEGGVAEHNHRYPPSRDDCPRCQRVRAALAPEADVTWRCWTCDYSTFFQVRRICRTQGHDVRRVEGKANV